jgi:hypothetical protein
MGEPDSLLDSPRARKLVAARVAEGQKEDRARRAVASQLASEIERADGEGSPFETDVLHLERLFRSIGMELFKYGTVSSMVNDAGWTIQFTVPSDWGYTYLRINDQGVYKLDETERVWDGMTWAKLKGV